jgi:hypothetical protein
MLDPVPINVAVKMTTFFDDLREILIFMLTSAANCGRKTNAEKQSLVNIQLVLWHTLQVQNFLIVVRVACFWIAPYWGKYIK